METTENNTVFLDLKKLVLVYCNNEDSCQNVKSSKQVIQLIKSIIETDTDYNFGGIGENSIESGNEQIGSKESFDYINEGKKEVFFSENTISPSIKCIRNIFGRNIKKYFSSIFILLRISISYLDSGSD